MKLFRHAFAKIALQTTCKLFLATIISAFFLSIPLQADARSTTKSSVSHSSSAKSGTSAKAKNVKRDSHGKLSRSAKAKDDFKKLHPCPATGKRTGACPGYVIDHVVALKRGGADNASNMQWQTISAAKAKDKWE